MLIKYEHFYAPLQINMLPGSSADATTRPGRIFIGLRLLKTLLFPNGFYKQLGFSLLPEITMLVSANTTPPTALILNTYSDAARIGLVQEYSFKLVPKVPGTMIYPYNSGYVTSLPASMNLTPNSVARVFYSTTFKLGENSTTADYVVEPGSVKIKRQRKTNPTLY